MLNLTLLIASLSTIILLLWRRFTFWSRQGIKSMNQFSLKTFKNEQEFTMELAKKYGKIYGGYTIRNRFLVVNDPDLIREIFIKHFHAFPHHQMSNLGPDPQVKKMLFFMPGNENWKRVRSIISPAFTSGKLKAMMSHISDISDKLSENLQKYQENGKTVDIRKYIVTYAMDVISACAFGIQIDSIDNPEHPVVTNANKIFGTEESLSKILLFNVARTFKLNFFNPIKYFGDLTHQIVTQRKNIYKNSNTQKDFIQLMIDSEKSDKYFGYYFNSDQKFQYKDKSQNKKLQTLSPDEMISQGIIFFIGGGTAIPALSHVVFFLSENKDCQQLLYEELKDVKEFSYENLSELKYLNAVIDETFRLAPPVTLIQRQCELDIEISGIKLTKGDIINVSAYAVHRDPDYWSEPNEFKPERFLQPEHHPWAYLPFGGGPRICVGQRFALNEMRMCCAKLFKRFEISLAPGFEKLEYFSRNSFLSPKNVMVNLRAR